MANGLLEELVAVKNQLDKHILLFCDDGAAATRVQHVVDSLEAFPSITWQSTFDVAKLKQRRIHESTPAGIILVVENGEGKQQLPTANRTGRRVRSLEGLVCDLSQTFCRSVFKRTLVLAERMNRFELQFLREFDIKLVQITSHFPTAQENIDVGLLKKFQLSTTNVPTPARHPMDTAEMARRIEEWNLLSGLEKTSLEESLKDFLGRGFFNVDENPFDAKISDPNLSFQIRLAHELKDRENHFNALILLAALKSHQGRPSDAIQILIRLNAWSPR